MQMPPRGADREGLEEFQELLDLFRTRLETELHEWLSNKRDAAASESVASDELSEVLIRFVERGGKRIRPALLYYAYKGCGGDAEEAVLPIAMAVELLHTYLLIHDDIMDHADLRRGEPSAHLLYRDLHAARGWQGDSDHFGRSSAILLGDLAQAYSLELVSSVEIAGALSSEFRECFAKMCQEVILGQYLEMTAAFRPDLGEEELLRVLQMKSGRYSVERPVQLGALLAGANPGEQQALREYGQLMGEAFQLQDDLLGMFGDTETVGKPVGGDLVEGKYTVLIHRTLGVLSSADRSRLVAALGNPDLGIDEVEAVQRLIESSGARRQVEEMIESRMRRAQQALETVDLTAEGRQFLHGLIDFLRGRSE